MNGKFQANFMNVPATYYMENNSGPMEGHYKLMVEFPQEVLPVTLDPTKPTLSEVIVPSQFANRDDVHIFPDPQRWEVHELLGDNVHWGLRVAGFVGDLREPEGLAVLVASRFEKFPMLTLCYQEELGNCPAVGEDREIGHTISHTIASYEGSMFTTSQLCAARK